MFGSDDHLTLTSLKYSPVAATINLPSLPSCRLVVAAAAAAAYLVHDVIGKEFAFSFFKIFCTRIAVAKERKEKKRKERHYM